MASKLTPISKLNKLIFFSTPKYQTFPGSSFSSASSRDQNAEHDDAMTQGVDSEGETGDPKQDHDNKDNIIPTREDDHYIHPKPVSSPFSSSKLQTSGVHAPIDPHVQQRRTKLARPAQLSCAGLDGSPLPDEEDPSRDEQQEDDKEYFKGHKASPLSNIEMGDTRKPLEKVAQATADGYFGGERVVTWLPEQMDTAEESLRRAVEMFREAAARGVPEWPHSRRLRELRGEDW